MSLLSCPLCTVSLPSSGLEAHLRQELDYPHIRCLLCRFLFSSKARALEHFEGPLAEHPGQTLRLSYLEKEPVKEQRLVELVRLAKGGQREVEKRLCVCGQCQLVCRGNYQYPKPLASNHATERMARPELREPGQHPMEAQRYAPNRDVLPKETDEPDKSEEEEEQEMPMDIKPDLNELKPKVNVDGKVPCIQCGMRIEKAWFKQHAVGAHSTARPFSCNLCPHNEKTKGALAKHQMKEHATELSEESFTFAGSEDKIREIVEQCFGSAKETDWARLRCQPCDKLVNTKHLKDHIAVHHLKKVIHTCKLCGFTNRELSAGNMNNHVKKAHQQRPGPDTVDSSQAQHYAPIIKNMIPQLFSK